MPELIPLNVPHTEHTVMMRERVAARDGTSYWTEWNAISQPSSDLEKTTGKVKQLQGQRWNWVDGYRRFEFDIASRTVSEWKRWETK